MIFRLLPVKNDLYKNYTSVAVLADTEELLFSEWGELYFKKRIYPHLPTDQTSSILEIGCGYGRYLSVLATLGYHHTFGIDISEEQISYARQQLQLSNVEQADAIEFLRTRPQQYDVIMLLDVVEHLELDYAITLLKEIYLALPLGGQVLIQVPNGLAPLSPNYYGDVTHVRLYSPKTMGQLLVMSGFTQHTHHELPPIAHGVKSAIRKVLWKGVFQPLIKGYLLAANGESMGGIYTSNFLTVATKV